MWRSVSLAVPVAAPVFAGELKAPRIARGIEEPGRFSPANAFDGDPATMFCAPDHASLVYYVPARDAKVLEQLTAIRVSAPDSGARTVAVHVYYPHVHDDHAELRATLDRGDTRIAVPATWDKRGAQLVAIDVGWATPAHAPVCVGEIELLGASGPLELPDLRAAVAKFRTRDRALASVHTVSKEYVTAFDWVYLNPHKMTSDWESALYELRADGTFTSTIDPADDDVDDHRVRRSTGTWKLVGTTLQLDDLRIRLGPCRAHPGYFCGDDLVPINAE